jgi:uncharacterized membrane protein YqhA
MIKFVFEKLLLFSRLFVLLPVIFGLIGSISLFMTATYDMISLARNVYFAFRHLQFSESLHNELVGNIIGAVDLYLVAIVLLIFSFGLYELFVSDIASKSGKNRLELPKTLAIHSLDELKDKLAKVIVMVLIVSFFQRVIDIKYSTSLEMFYFAISISALSVGVYLLKKEKKNKEKSMMQ